MVTNIMSEPYLPTQTGEALCNIQLQLTEQMITINRTYTKLLDVLGDVGVLMEFVFSFFKLLSIFLTETLYEKSLVNNLFTFDLDKKIIELKKIQKTKTNFFQNEVENIKPIKSMNKTSSKVSLYGIEDTIKNKNMMNDGILSNEVQLNNEPISVVPLVPSINSNSLIRKKKKKIKKRRMTFSSRLDIVSEEDIKIKNEFKSKDEIKIVKISNKSNDLERKNPETEISDRKIIEKIQFSSVFLFFCLFYARKKKNLQNVLIDEGMRMVSQNLDIINIFINQMRVNNYLEHIKDNLSIIMSDEAKKEIDIMFVPIKNVSK